MTLDLHRQYKTSTVIAVLALSGIFLGILFVLICVILRVPCDCIDWFVWKCCTKKEHKELDRD